MRQDLRGLFSLHKNFVECMVVFTLSWPQNIFCGAPENENGREGETDESNRGGRRCWIVMQVGLIGCQDNNKQHGEHFGQLKMEEWTVLESEVGRNGFFLGQKKAEAQDQFSPDDS